MGKSTISMAIFHSYVSLPEGIDRNSLLILWSYVLTILRWAGWAGCCHDLIHQLSKVYRFMALSEKMLSKMARVRIVFVDFHHKRSTGWWFQPLWKIWKSDWIIIPTIGENKKCSKPPTSQKMLRYPMVTTAAQWPEGWRLLRRPAKQRAR